MKVYWVLGYYQYYPEGDNFLASFETYEEAQAFVDQQEARDDPMDCYDIVNITSRL